ncbi:MAG: hypothetical protein WBA43_19365 [Elainellaceae cyanobacterium]
MLSIPQPAGQSPLGDRSPIPQHPTQTGMITGSPGNREWSQQTAGQVLTAIAPGLS